MGKILLIDVDGTLVNYENQLPASAANAIRKARANGHKVYICTGRSKAEVYPNLWEIGLDGMIGGNGSYVEDHGKVVMHQLITKEQCTHVVDWLHGRGLEFYLESNNGLFASENFETAGEPVIQLYSARKGKAGAEPGSWRCSETWASRESQRRTPWSACWSISGQTGRTRSHLEMRRWTSLCSSAAPAASAWAAAVKKPRRRRTM